MDKKKIAIGYAHSGKNIGGVRRYIENIDQLSSYDVTLFPSYENDNEWRKEYNIQIRNDYRNNEIKAKQQEIINNHDIFHSNVDPTFIKLCEEAQKQGKLWVHTYHNIYIPCDEPDGQLKEWQKEINDIQFNIASKANICICVGEWLVDECKKQNINSLFIPNFIDISILNNIYKNNFKNRYSLDKFILFAGDVSIRKNCKEFIQLGNILPNYKFVLIGTGLNKEEIEKTHSVTLSDNIIAMGPLQHNECLEAMKDCSILIMNSFTEGLPTVLLEALYFSKPCIIPDGPDWSNHLLTNENYGYKYPIGNIEKLAEIVNSIMKNYSEKIKAKEYVEKTYSSNVIIKKIDDIYSNLLKLKRKILFTSLDNKFIEEIINLYKDECEVKIDLFYQNNEEKRKKLLNWADIIFCEWCEANAEWYSKNKNSSQKLYIRLHRYELFTSFLYKIKWNNVDNIIFIAPEMQKLANKHLLQSKYVNDDNFDWEYYLNNNDDLFKNLNYIDYNKYCALNHWNNIGNKMNWNRPSINLIDNINYDNTICDEFKHFNGGKLIYNYVKSNMFIDIKKQYESEYNIGIMGILPKIKRLDIGIDIIENLIKKNKKYKLYVLGKNYKEWPGTSKNNDEIEYYEKLNYKINNSELKNHVIYENHSENPELWFAKIGYILSVSDIEGSHQAIAEGMATGSIPFIYGKALKIYKLDDLYPKKYCYYEDNINNLCDNIIKYTNDNNLRTDESLYCKKFSYDNFNVNKIKCEYDSLLF